MLEAVLVECEHEDNGRRGFKLEIRGISKEGLLEKIKLANNSGCLGFKRRKPNESYSGIGIKLGSDKHVESISIYFKKPTAEGYAIMEVMLRDTAMTREVYDQYLNVKISLHMLTRAEKNYLKLDNKLKDAIKKQMGAEAKRIESNMYRIRRDTGHPVPEEM